MYKHYRFDIMHVVLNTENGEIRYFEREVNDNRQYEIFLMADGKFTSHINFITYTSFSYSKLTLSLNLTTKCNFNCKYCFSDHENGSDFIKIDSLTEVIEEFIKRKLGNQSLFIDLS